MDTVIDSPRKFQLWRAVVNHSQVLLWSTKGNGYRTRIEVLFKSVFAVKMFTSMRGLRVREGGESDVAAVLGECGVEALSPGLRVFVLADGGGFEGWIIAGSVFVSEDDGEYDEPSTLL